MKATRPSEHLEIVYHISSGHKTQALWGSRGPLGKSSFLPGIQ